MSIVRKIKRALRGEVDAKTASLEVLRRTKAAMAQRRERAGLQQGQRHQTHLNSSYAEMPASELLNHFRSRSDPKFLPGFNGSPEISDHQRKLFPNETAKLIALSNSVVSDHAWSIMGLGRKQFGAEIDWHQDPVSGIQWPLEFHADIELLRGDGSDVRVLWELNRLPHFIMLARAYAVTGDERFSAEFIHQLESWQAQNLYGYGANWNCAMEVALRAINLLGAFQVFVHSSVFNEQTLATVLSLLDQHGRFIRENLEFSYVATSNHYLSDLVGLVWLGVMLPELESAASWREFGLREMLREMDKQVLDDGADFESSTGYHRFVLELFLYTFILCRANRIDVAEPYWQKLKAMLNYLRAYLRPDGRAPLIGDTDGGQVFPVRARDADDHAYLLAIGGVVFNDAALVPEEADTPEELLWILGPHAVNEFDELRRDATKPVSANFPDAGIYILREDDLWLSFNASGPGIDGRGSHGHNDALSIEVSACGVAFVADPGSFVYTADLKERHRFRSTAYHSTVEIDGTEQNTIDEQTPFVIGSEGEPKILIWQSTNETDRVSGEHYGYMRLREPVTHRRTVTFNKRERWWMVEDEFSGSGVHELATRFHLDSGLEVNLAGDTSILAYDKMSGARLMIGALGAAPRPDLEKQFISKNYYSKEPSITACWRSTSEVPCTFQWILIPACGSAEGSTANMNLRFEQARLLLKRGMA